MRFSSEGFSTALFAIGYAGIAHRREGAGPWAALLSGALLGLAVVARLQMALMVAGLIAWCLFIARVRWSVLLNIMAGSVIGFGAGVLIDRWFYGEWVFTAWNYIDVNMMQGKAADFGTQPWWHYFAALFERMLPPFSLLFLAPPLLFFALRRREALTWTVLPFIVGHCLIAHKEFRFMFPVLPLLPPLVVGGLLAMDQRGWFNRISPGVTRFLRAAFLVAHVPALCIVLFKPAQDEAGFYRELYRLPQAGDTILHEDHDPYWQGIPVWYTRPKGVGIAPMNSLEAWPSSGRVFLARRKADANVPDPPFASLLYSSLPDWLLRIKIGGWVDRTAAWQIWELQKPTDWKPSGG